MFPVFACKTILSMYLLNNNCQWTEHRILFLVIHVNKIKHCTMQEYLICNQNQKSPVLIMCDRKPTEQQFQFALTLNA